MATLVLLPGEFHEQRSLVGFSRKELDMTVPRLLPGTLGSFPGCL